MLAFFQCLTLSGTWSLYDTCWWYSLCHFQDRQQHYETVGFIRTCIYFYFMFEHKDEYDLTLFSMLLSGPVELLRPFECVWTDGTWSLYHTCRWYSLCHFQYRPHSEHTCSDHFDCWMYTNLSFWILMCQYKDEYDLTLMLLIFSWLGCCGNGVRVCRTEECTWSLCYTCWWYSLCNFQYRQHYENTCSYNVDCWIYTNLYFCIFIVCVNTRTSIKQD
jgi:hypothetical protein